MTIEIMPKKKLQVRSLRSYDTEKLFRYLDHLSPETRSRFGPHEYDWSTVQHICSNLKNDDVLRYVAENEEGEFVAYMLVKKGYTDYDLPRLVNYGLRLNSIKDCTFAPSIADTHQDMGLGSRMFKMILEDLEYQKFERVLLWGGVQSANQRAVHFYEKFGFKRLGNFWHDNVDNIDMIKNLE